jgi:hypothetical protein
MTDIKDRSYTISSHLLDNFSSSFVLEPVDLLIHHIKEQPVATRRAPV